MSDTVKAVLLVVVLVVGLSFTIGMWVHKATMKPPACADAADSKGTDK